MQGRIVPPEILLLEPPWWKNFFWNMATVQFDHRLIAWLLAIAVPVLWWRLRRTDVPRRARAGATGLLAMLGCRLRSGLRRSSTSCRCRYAMHQAGAVAVFALALNVAHALR